MTGFRDALGHSIEATRRAARDALQVFGEPGSGDEWALAALPPALADQQRDEVKRGFFQLLLVLADAVSELPGAPPAQRAHEALGIVNRAEGLLSRPTKAYRLRRADFLERNGDLAAAARERAETERLAPSDAFDFFLLGRRVDETVGLAQGDQATRRGHSRAT